MVFDLTISYAGDKSVTRAIFMFFTNFSKSAKY